MTDEELLIYLYYDKKNYDGINELFRKAKIIHPNIKLEFVKQWLSKQYSTQLTTEQIKPKTEFLPIFSESPFSFQIDLTFFPRYKKQNKGLTVLFTAININSRFVYAYALYDKSMESIIHAFKKMNEKTEIDSITTDEGKEFKNKEFIKYCHDNDIEIHFVKGDSHKLGIINRFHRTLKEKLLKHFISSDSVKWYDVIDNIIENYNNSFHRGIKDTPKNINSFNLNKLITEKRNKTNKLKDKNQNLQIGDSVRIIENKMLFDDKMIPKYSKDTYEIIKINNNSVVLDLGNGEKITIKKSKIKKIPEVIEGYIQLKELDRANKEHKESIARRKHGISQDNIIIGKRI